jgi:pantetheine-phosphate adenylyltransferase
MRIAIFPGSFNPFTVGHKLIVDEALKIFDRVVICQFINSDKEPENIDIWRIRKLFSEDERIVVTSSNEMVGDFCLKHNITHIVRGIRNAIDYEYENNIARINRELFPSLTTIFIPTDSFVSSSFVRECQKYGKDVSKYTL